MLQRTKTKRARFKAGYPERLTVACIGDSWVFNGSRWVQDFARRLSAEHGSAGPGWCGFYRHSDGKVAACADSMHATVTHTGSWTLNPLGVPTADLGVTRSSVVGDSIAVAISAPVDAVTLSYVPTTGTIRYRYNGGDWVSLALTGGLSETVPLATPPEELALLEIEVESGEAALAGVTLARNVDGVRVHKIGRAGASTNHWYNVDATAWPASLAALSPDLIVFVIGTNDQATTSLTNFLARYTAVIARMQAALPTAEILLVAPCENLAGRAAPMWHYTAITRALSEIHGVSFLDLQPVFGTTPTTYAHLFEDTVHPMPGAGGLLIAEAVLKAMA
jgi:lysophospholipase L1-like esterase